MQKLQYNIKTKEKVWEAFEDEKKFKELFPMSSNRATIYSKVAQGEDPIVAANYVQRIIKENIHEHHQQNVTKKHKYHFGV